MKSSRFQRGMTLIEIVVVLAIIAILAAISYPSYVDYTNRTKRTDGKNALVDLAARQERYRFGNNSYATTLAQLNMPATSAEGHYTISITAADAQTFTAQVTPGVTQAADKCQSLTITNTGLKGTINSYLKPATECWK